MHASGNRIWLASERRLRFATIMPAVAARAGAVAVVALIMSLALLGGARAQEQRTVQGDTSTVIRTSAAEIRIVAQPTKGRAQVEEFASEPKRWSLVYWAPVVAAEATDIVAYSIGGSQQTTVVTITPHQVSGLDNDEIYSQSFKFLFVLFVLAVVLESGLAVIFNWRPFLQYFDSRGVKTVVSVAFALVFVNVFELDLAARLVNVYSGSEHPVGFAGKFLTALVLAGGSSGVNNLMVALGFRAIRSAQQDVPKPPPDKAWLQVRLVRDQADGPVTVLLSQELGPLSVAGVIKGTSPESRLWRYFVRDQGCFPTAGGHAVPKDKSYEIKLIGTNRTGAPVSATWGPHHLAAGAIVDIEMKL